MVEWTEEPEDDTEGKRLLVPKFQNSHREIYLRFHGVGHTTSNAIRNWKNVLIGKNAKSFLKQHFIVLCSSIRSFELLSI